MLTIEMGGQNMPGEKGDVVWSSECEWLDLMADEAKLFGVIEILKQCRVDIICIYSISLDYR